jgi:hypothetical protein
MLLRRKRRIEAEEANDKAEVETNTKIGQAVALTETIRDQLSELRSVLNELQETQ